MTNGISLPAFLFHTLRTIQRRWWRALVMLVSVIFITPTSAVIDDAPTFANQAQYQQYNELISIIRCPTCQNQNIAESNAALARQLRQIIVTKIHDGESSDSIISYLVERYGDFITYDPPFKPITWLLWLGPVVLMLMALFYWAVARRKGENARLSPAERETLQAVLDKYR